MRNDTTHDLAIKAANWAMKDDPDCAKAFQRTRAAKEELAHLRTIANERGNRRLDEHPFRSLGKLVVGNLNRIAHVDNIGN